MKGGVFLCESEKLMHS